MKEKTVVNNISMVYDQDNEKTKYSLHPFPEYMEQMEKGIASITVDTSQPIGTISPCFMGYNIEDLNQMINPGLYAQMLYGESFEDMPMQKLPEGFDWHAEPINDDTPKDPYNLQRWRGEFFFENSELTMIGCRQRRIYTDTVQMKNGTISCQVFQPSTERNYYGPALLACRRGSDYYYITLVPERNIVSIGKGYEKNFTPSAKIFGQKEMPLEYDRWYTLTATFHGGNITVYVDHKEAFTCTDPHPIEGGIGLDASFTYSKFRNLIVTPEGEAPVHFDFSMKDRPYTHAANISRWWEATIHGNATGRFSWSSENAYNTDRCQGITLLQGEGAVGVRNAGLHGQGLYFKKDYVYTGHLYLRGDDDLPVTISLCDKGGNPFVSTTLTGIKNHWKRFDFSLLSPTATEAGTLSITIHSPGTVYADQVLLFPDKRDLYKGLLVRKDMAKKLEENGITHLRFGGDMINTWNFDWKLMLTPKDKRRQYLDGWSYHKSAQFMIFEFLEFAEALGVTPILNLGEHYAPEGVQEFIEYMNGDASTYWGQKRWENGHPEPYHIEYFMYGNGMPPMDQLRKVEELSHIADPSLKMIAGDVGHVPWFLLPVVSQKLTDEFNTFASKYQIISSRPEVSLLSSYAVWEDVIMDARAAFPCLQEGTLLYAEEVNGGAYDWQRGLCNASFEITSEKHADIIFGQSYCNLSQGHGHLYEWNQGGIHFTNSKVWCQPSYYAIQMAAKNLLDISVKTTTAAPHARMEKRGPKENEKVMLPLVLSSTTLSKSSEKLCLKVVNFSGGDMETTISLGGFSPKTMDITTMHTRHLKAVNSIENPDYIIPKTEKSLPSESIFTYVLKPCSYTIFMFNK